MEGVVNIQLSSDGAKKKVLKISPVDFRQDLEQQCIVRISLPNAYSLDQRILRLGIVFIDDSCWIREFSQQFELESKDLNGFMNWSWRSANDLRAIGRELNDNWVMSHDNNTYSAGHE